MDEPKIYKGLTTAALFAFSERSIAYPLLKKFDYPWESLDELGNYIREIGKALSPQEYNNVGDNIYISKSANIAQSASIKGPCIICHGAEIRHSAFIRENVIVGSGATVGNSSELKNCILFDGAQAPHFNYVGDSIIGYKSHMGAGAICSNFKSDGRAVNIKFKDQSISTGRRKLGAIIGDFAEIGCGCILNPGSVIGPNTTIYPLSSVRGYVPNNVIYKSLNSIIEKV